jgi:predicted dehydrogenase
MTPQAMQGITYRKAANDGKNALELELSDFLAAVRQGGRPKVNGRDGLKALEVASRVMASMDSALRAME